MTTLRTSHADRNYLSISDNTAQLYLGTDHPEPYRLPEDKPLNVVPAFPQDWDAVLKVSSNDYAVRLYEVRIAQGRENAVDCNRYAADVDIKGDFGWGGGVGDQVFTIKGGSHHITLWGDIHSRGRNADAVLGMWSDQSTDPVHHIDLVGLKRKDGKPVTVVFVRADRKTIALPAHVKVLRVKSLLFTAYWWLKLAAVKLGVVR